MRMHSTAAGSGSVGIVDQAGLIEQRAANCRPNVFSNRHITKQKPTISAPTKREVGGRNTPQHGNPATPVGKWIPQRTLFPLELLFGLSNHHSLTKLRA